VLAITLCVAVLAQAQADNCLPQGDGNQSASYFSSTKSLCVNSCTSTCVPKPGKTSGIYYTIYSGFPNIWKADLVIDDAANPPTISTNNDHSVASTTGADGIVGSPVGNKLYIGAQGNNAVNVYDLDTQSTVVVHAPVPVYHMTVIATGLVGGPYLFGTDIGSRQAARFTINSDGSLSNPIKVTVTGSDTGITTLIKGPNGSYYYVSDFTGGGGSSGQFGTVTVSTDGSSMITSAKLTNPTNIGGCYHGGYYDSFSESILLWGGNKVCQYVIATGELRTTTHSGKQYDQGTPDGLGHIFIANNQGSLDWWNYQATKDIRTPSASGVVVTRGYLDDVAPLVGGGSAC